MHVLEMNGEVEYCVCKKPATGDMVLCDHCNKWFHLPCVSLSTDEKDRIQSFICPSCEVATGKQTKWKKKRTSKKGANNAVKMEEEKPVEETKKSTPRTRQKEPIPPPNPSPPQDSGPRRSSRTKVKHNYSELNDGIQVASATKELIVVDYVKMLSKAKCLKDDEVPRKVLGEDLTIEYLAENGFREPLIVENAEHLGMKMPPSTITVRRVEEIVGTYLTSHPLAQHRKIVFIVQCAYLPLYSCLCSQYYLYHTLYHI